MFYIVDNNKQLRTRVEVLDVSKFIWTLWDGKSPITLCEMEENVGKSFKAPQTRIAPMNLGGEKKRNMNAGKQD